MPGGVELRGFEPLTPCMPSPFHRQTGHHGALPHPSRPQIEGLHLCRLVVSREVPCGRGADRLLTTPRCLITRRAPVGLPHRSPFSPAWTSWAITGTRLPPAEASSIIARRSAGLSYGRLLVTAQDAVFPGARLVKRGSLPAFPLHFLTVNPPALSLALL
jgi:hypothetical protein